MRFYLDECINPAVVGYAESLGVDVSDWRSGGMAGWSDVDQLRHAARAGRCIVTSNCWDFKRDTRAFRAAGEPHAGVLCLNPWAFDLGDSQGIAQVLATFAARHPNGLAPYEVVSDSMVIRGLRS